MNENTTKLIRIGEVSNLTTISKSHLYYLIRNNRFPRPIKISEHTSVWDIKEVNDWILSKKSARGEEQ
ncbi:AlpA family phage regulatory protein [Thiomicrorhabdus sp. zzn3]|uniref:helix-turn-helix transcriptional regulator n=1 Tax=Thiomicrorhabdus sp. zzn3 TaxID=3039775 RepID=UPI002436BEFC|nr:AlpA family phage regulatory protein [Thiomicrorhabdus sp. zzn3]MDG6777687.1 AlpA family phage regulatory protein [Thiomicrorhabdus sp. zzn3]